MKAGEIKKVLEQVPDDADVLVSVISRTNVLSLLTKAMKDGLDVRTKGRAFPIMLVKPPTTSEMCIVFALDDEM